MTSAINNAETKILKFIGYYKLIIRAYNTLFNLFWKNYTSRNLDLDYRSSNSNEAIVLINLYLLIAHNQNKKNNKKEFKNKFIKFIFIQS